jgi:hypothetical protein
VESCVQDELQEVQKTKRNTKVRRLELHLLSHETWSLVSIKHWSWSLVSIKHGVVERCEYASLQKKKKKKKRRRRIKKKKAFWAIFFSLFKG